jgi:DNA repair exonuclease SbcCD ATPase subunit
MFTWAEIEGFRGFRDRQRIDLDSSVVILAGPNGTGKTSLFDALQWLLLGSLERLEPWRTRKNTEHIANVFRPEEPAVVRAEVRIGDQLVELRRQGRHDTGFLEWSDSEGVVRGDEAERRLAASLSPRAGDKASLRRLLMTSALLQQDVVREVLEDKATDRYEQLASLLGLDQVGAFESATRRRADRLAASGTAARGDFAALEGQHRQALARVDTLRAQQAAAPDTTRVRTELAERLSSEAAAVRLTVALPAIATDALLLQSNVAEVGDEMARLAGQLDALLRDSETAGPVDDETLVRVRAGWQEAERRANEAGVALAAAETNLAAAMARSEALAALAHTALPLLGDTCPVCQQDIVKEDVARHLVELVERGGVDLSGLEQVRAASRAAAQVTDAERQQAEAALAGLTERQLTATRLADEREKLLTDLRSVAKRAEETGLQLQMADQLERLDRPAVDATISALRAVWRVTGDLASVLRTLPVGDDLAAAEVEVRRLDGLLTAARERTSAASAREEEARTLQRAATRSATAVADTRFRLLAPLVGNIFSRLDPHPVFKTLDFTFGVYRERGVASPVVRDDQLDVEADPLLVFSSSQANVAALSCFLALGWAAGTDGMPFVLLDDPLQSLDDVNALGFADLCRHIRRQRQLIVSTHDPRLAALLERKLAPRTEHERTRVVEFKAWTRRGPDIEPRVVEPQLAEGKDRTLAVTEAA